MSGVDVVAWLVSDPPNADWVTQDTELAAEHAAAQQGVLPNASVVGLVKHTDYLRVVAERDAWQSLYKRAFSTAGGLTNYIEDRPELTHAERALETMRAEAAALSARNQT